MISKNTTIFTDEDGIRYQFNFDAFIDTFRLESNRRKTSPKKFEIIIADMVKVTPSAVHNWRYKLNGPSDADMIKGIAKALNLSDWKTLMTNHIRGENDMKLTEKQTESLKRVYDAIIDFLDDFKKTGGFTTDLWYEFEKEGWTNPEYAIEEYAVSKQYEVIKVLKKEYFYLHDLPVYDKLYDYAWDSLSETFCGKCGYAFRFEAYPSENGNGDPTTTDDYEKAMTELHNIIMPYI